MGSGEGEGDAKKAWARKDVGEKRAEDVVEPETKVLLQRCAGNGWRSRVARQRRCREAPEPQQDDQHPPWRPRRPHAP
jgi:hypothetical protein